MPSTLDIRRRIRSVKNTQQITKAMKMVAAAKLRRAQEKIFAARPYAAALREMIASVAGRVEGLDHPLLRVREEKRVVLLVVTADKGLCGAFNTNVVKAAQVALRDQPWESTELIPVGRKGSDFFRRRPVKIKHQVLHIYQALKLESVREIATMITKDYAEENIDAVYAVYNEFKSVIAQRVLLEKILPIERITSEEQRIDYLYEPGPEEIIHELLPKHIEFQLFRILLESAAAEQGARMTAMEAATKNAADMIDHLTLTYNRIRQAAITKEIIEIVSGAAALD